MVLFLWRSLIFNKTLNRAYALSKNVKASQSKWEIIIISVSLGEYSNTYN